MTQTVTRPSLRYLLLLLLMQPVAYAETVIVQPEPDESVQGSSYPDGHGGQVYFPLGDVSFADQVIEYRQGTPAPTSAEDTDPAAALATPNYDHRRGVGFVSLGCGGSLVLQFVDNALIDTPGPDLHVFEVGKALEPMTLEISFDAKQWLSIGQLEGGRADVDIGPYVKPTDLFRYVRLTDLEKNCGWGSPGADIDAVGAIGSGLRLKIQSAVLFDFNSAELRPSGRQEMHRVAEQMKKYPGARVFVSGFTDNIGGEAYNLKLSERRAQAVSRYLATQVAKEDFQFNINGFGESQPVASNDTEEGQQANRRVEVIIVPIAQAEIQAGAEAPAR